MNKLLATALVWMLICGAAVAANNAPASDASIREMLELTNAQQMLEGMKGQMTGMMNAAMQNATKDQTVTPERQAILDRMTDQNVRGRDRHAELGPVAADLSAYLSRIVHAGRNRRRHKILQKPSRPCVRQEIAARDAECHEGNAGIHESPFKKK